MLENLPKIPKEKQVTYVAHLNAHTPYELYLDDILIDYHLEGDNMNKTVQLNPYLLGNGKHHLKIRYYPRTNSKDSLLHPKEIIFSKDVKWNIFFTEIYKDAKAPLGYSHEIDYQNAELPVSVPPAPVPFWEQTWEINVDKLPYKFEGWTNSQDLSKMDKDELEKEVLDFFNKARTMLNEGRKQEFISLKNKVDREVYIAIYDDDIEWFTSEDRLNELERCIGNMQPIDNYEMRLFAEGRLVTLLIPSGELKNWGALLSITPKGRENYYHLLLHKPKGSNKFEVIRS